MRESPSAEHRARQGRQGLWVSSSGAHFQIKQKQVVFFKFCLRMKAVICTNPLLNAVRFPETSFLALVFGESVIKLGKLKFINEKG